MRIRYVAMEVVMKSASLKSVRIVISRTSLQERMRAAVFYEFTWRASVLCSTANNRKQMCGVRGIRNVVKKKRSTGGRRVAEKVLGECHVVQFFKIFVCFFGEGGGGFYF